jgi:hypothetical protein
MDTDRAVVKPRLLQHSRPLRLRSSTDRVERFPRDRMLCEERRHRTPRSKSSAGIIALLALTARSGTGPTGAHDMDGRQTSLERVHIVGAA